MNNLNKTSKIIATVLSVCFIISAFMPVSALAAVDATRLGSMVLTSEYAYQSSRGVRGINFITNSANGGAQVKNYALEVDINDPTVSIITGYKDYSPSSWGRQTVKDQAMTAEKARNVNVVAGVNGDFFNMDTGEPRGVFIMNGQICHETSDRPLFAIYKDGTAAILAPGSDLKGIAEAVGGRTILLRNGKKTKNCKNNGKDIQPRTSVGIKSDGKVVFLVNDGRQSPESCGMTFYKAAQILIAMGCVDALALDGGGSSTLISQSEGDHVLKCRNNPSDGNERAVASSLLVCSTAVETNVLDHVYISPEMSLITPGDSVSFSATAIDTGCFKMNVPEDGKYVIDTDIYGDLSGDTFESNGTPGTVTISYVIDNKTVGTTSVKIEPKKEDIMSWLTLLIQKINNIIADIQQFFIIKNI